MRYPKNEIQEAYTKLRRLLRKGNTLYTILRRVSKSGMSRVIAVVVIKNNQPVDISWEVARVLGRSYVHTELGNGVRINGAGMDMGYEIVYSLSYALFKDGYALKHRWL